MISNFLQRSFTSLLLLILIFFAFEKKIILITILIVTAFFLFYEFYKILNKINLSNKKKLFFSYILTTIYIIFFICLVCLYLLTENEKNELSMIYILLICISTDIGGYIFGKTFKGKRLTKISPNKTYSGMCGSFLASIIVYFFFNHLFSFDLKYLYLSLIISMISQSGDLFISFLKRKAKLKDTGNLLPGHGGILDRIDGIIFAVPLSILLFIYFKI